MSRLAGGRERGLRPFLLAACSALSGGLLIPGCGASVQETHYFAGYRDGKEGEREAVQFYRLRISGKARMSNARYLSGTFDERAVSLFFNEMKSPKDGKLFEESAKLPGEGETTVKPLSPTDDHGAFMLIMSTNADSVANAIGSFAESQAVADSLTNLLNRSDVSGKLKSDSEVSTRKREATAMMERLSAFTDGQPSSQAEALANHLHALTVLAQGLGYAGAEFATLQTATDWFALESAHAKETK